MKTLEFLGTNIGCTTLQNETKSFNLYHSLTKRRVSTYAQLHKHTIQLLKKSHFLAYDFPDSFFFFSHNKEITLKYTELTFIQL